MDVVWSGIARILYTCIWFLFRIFHSLFQKLYLVFCVISIKPFDHQTAVRYYNFLTLRSIFSNLTIKSASRMNLIGPAFAVQSSILSCNWRHNRLFPEVPRDPLWRRIDPAVYSRLKVLNRVTGSENGYLYIKIKKMGDVDVEKIMVCHSLLTLSFLSNCSANVTLGHYTFHLFFIYIPLFGDSTPSYFSVYIPSREPHSSTTDCAIWIVILLEF